jgi:hypothetical protein
MFFMYFFCLPLLAHSIILDYIPSSGIPPDLFYASGITYDPITASVLIFGGHNMKVFSYLNTLYSFSLITNRWSIILPESQFIPDPICSPILYLRADRVLLSISGCSESGYISDIYIFDLISKSWILADKKVSFGFCFASTATANINGSDFIAIYGGVADYGISSRFFL